MAEFVWKDQIKIVTREWTRGELLTFWGRIVKGGDLNALVEQGMLGDARLEEYVAAQSTAEVSIQNGKGWKPVTDTCQVAGYTLQFPLTPETLQGLPNSLVDGWINASKEENGDLSTLLNFTNRPIRSSPQNGTSTSAKPSES